MKKRKYSKKTNTLYKIGILSIFISIFLVSIGYSAFRQDLSVADVVASITPVAKIRITSVVVDSTSDANSYSNSAGHSDTEIQVNTHLNDETSWVKYHVSVNNLGNKEMGIANYLENTLPSNLDYEITGYDQGDVLCDDNTPSKCSLNATTSFYITIKYKSSVTNANPSDYSVSIGLDFKTFFNVTYDNGICNNCTSKVINGGSLNVTLSNYNVVSVYMDNLILIKNTDYTFNTTSGLLVKNNVTGDIRIESLSYSKLLYIESTGTTDKQYIDTLYVPKYNTTVVYDGMTVSGDTALFGVREVQNGSKAFTIQYISANLYRASFAKVQIALGSEYVINTRYLFKMDTYNMYIDNVPTATFSSTASSTFVATGNLYLFALHTANAATNFGSNRVYSFKIYEDNTLVKNFIPVLDGNDVPCLYETIEGKFYYNKGAGTFNYGTITKYSITNNVNYIYSSNAQTQVNAGDSYTTTYTPTSGRSLPTSLLIASNGINLENDVDYVYNNQTGALTINEVNGNIVVSEMQKTELEYINSTGVQYIDTGITPTLNTKVVFTHIPLVITYSKWVAYFGTKSSDTNENTFYASSGANAVSAWVGNLQISNGNNSYNHTLNSTQVITLTADEFRIVEDGVTKLTRTNTGTQSFNNPGSIYIFGRNAGGTLNYPGTFKVKSFQIYESDVLIMDLIPVINQAGIYCFYDNVTGNYFYNQGSSNFSGA